MPTLLTNTALLIFLLLKISSGNSSRVFYREKGRYLKGRIIKTMSVDEPTDCVGTCMHMGKCMAFNVNGTTRGNYVCEFLSENHCGYVETVPDSTIFCSHKQCTFHVVDKDNLKCVTLTDAGFFREATGFEACVSFNLNLDGSGFKVDGECVAVKEERGENNVDWLVKSSFTDDRKCQVKFNGSNDETEIREVSSKKCITKYTIDSYTYLVLGGCNERNFKIKWQKDNRIDTLDSLAREILSIY